MKSRHARSLRYRIHHRSPLTARCLTKHGLLKGLPLTDFEPIVLAADNRHTTDVNLQRQGRHMWSVDPHDEDEVRSVYGRFMRRLTPDIKDALQRRAFKNGGRIEFLGTTGCEIAHQRQFSSDLRKMLETLVFRDNGDIHFMEDIYNEDEPLEPFLTKPNGPYIDVKMCRELDPFYVFVRSIGHTDNDVKRVVTKPLRERTRRRREQ